MAWPVHIALNLALFVAKDMLLVWHQSAQSKKSQLCVCVSLANMLSSDVSIVSWLFRSLLHNSGFWIIVVVGSTVEPLKSRLPVVELLNNGHL
jgi:hypothetical protein